MCFRIFWNEQRPFQRIKIKSLRSRQIEIFSKGLTNGFLQKWAIYTFFFFQLISARKTCFKIFQNQKRPLQAIKTRSSKRRKIEIFPKGLIHGFGQKVAIFPSFLRQYRPVKCVLRYSRTKKRLSSLQKREVQKVSKLRFF